jgi:hypothetical protein
LGDCGAALPRRKNFSESDVSDSEVFNSSVAGSFVSNPDQLSQRPFHRNHFLHSQLRF